MQLAAVAGAIHITLKTRKTSWAVLTLCSSMIVLRRMMAGNEAHPAHLEVVSFVISGALLWGMILVHKEHSSQVDYLVSLADSVPSMVWIADSSGNVEYANKRMLDYTGWSQVQFHDLREMELVHPDDQHAVLSSWLASVKTQTPFQSEHRMRRCDGVYHWFLARAVPVCDNNGRVIRWYGTATDIEDTKHLEFQIQAARKA